MSRDSTGRYFLPPVINPVRANTIIATKWANPTLDDIAAALTDSVPRSGSVPLLGPLNMNGYKITNVGYATLPTDAPQAQQIRDRVFQRTRSRRPTRGELHTGTLLTAPGSRHHLPILCRQDQHRPDDGGGERWCGAADTD
jgi:hypothetical protein